MTAEDLNHNDASWFMTNDGGFIGSKDSPHHGEIAETALGGLDPKDKGTGEDWNTLYKFMKDSKSVRSCTGDDKSVNFDVNSVPTDSQMRKMASLSKGKTVHWNIGGPKGVGDSGSFADFQRALDKSLPSVSGGAPDTVGTEEAADKDNEHFANAKKELGSQGIYL